MKINSIQQNYQIKQNKLKKRGFVDANPSFSGKIDADLLKKIKEVGNLPEYKFSLPSVYRGVYEFINAPNNGYLYYKKLDGKIPVHQLILSPIDSSLILPKLELNTKLTDMYKKFNNVDSKDKIYKLSKLLKITDSSIEPIVATQIADFSSPEKVTFWSLIINSFSQMSHSALKTRKFEELSPEKLKYIENEIKNMEKL